MLLTCKYCGKTYDGAAGSSACASCVAERRKTTLAPRTCRTCNTVFMGGPRAWYCPDCRAERQKKSSRESKSRQSKGTQRALGSTDICTVCGKPYIINSARQRYCPDCRDEQYKIADRQAGLDWYAENGSANDRRAERNAAVVQLSCAICGKPLTQSSGGKKYCSRDCANAAIRERNRASKPRIPCPICGTVFAQTHGKKYCCRSCNAEAVKRRNRKRTD